VSRAASTYPVSELDKYLTERGKHQVMICGAWALVQLTCPSCDITATLKSRWPLLELDRRVRV
jgi:hypothetical protein